MYIRYHQVKFIERQKLTRLEKATKRSLQTATLENDTPQIALLQTQLQSIAMDQLYIALYPTDRKYLALFTHGNNRVVDDEKGLKKRRGATFESSSSSSFPSSHSVDSEATLPLPTPPPYVPAEAHAGTNSHNNNTPSPSPPTIINPNDNDYNTNNIAHHTTQYFTAISAAKSRLQLAQIMASQSQQNLSRAQNQYQSSHLEGTFNLTCHSLERVESSCTCLTSFHSANTVSSTFDSLQRSY